MKKTLLFMLALVLALPAMALNAGDTFMYDGLYYTVLDENAETCKVVAVANGTTNSYSTLLSGDLVIPANPTDGTTQYTLTQIDWQAFMSCNKLTSVTIPNTVIYIGEYAFDGCTSLKSVVIPNSVITIDESAFDSCTSLTDVTIGSSVTTIGDEAFIRCPNIENIYYLPSTGVAANENIFDSSVYTNASLYVNYGSDKAVRSVSPWSKFTNSITTGVESVEISDVNAAVEVYTLGGVKVADSVENLPAGLYIVRQGSKVTKVAVK
jgi:hypothetical protein